MVGWRIAAALRGVLAGCDDGPSSRIGVGIGIAIGIVGGSEIEAGSVPIMVMRCRSGACGDGRALGRGSGGPDDAQHVADVVKVGAGGGCFFYEVTYELDH